MLQLEPVEHDPFATAAPAGATPTKALSLEPIEGDPFAAPVQNNAANAASPSVSRETQPQVAEPLSTVAELGTPAVIQPPLQAQPQEPPAPQPLNQFERGVMTGVVGAKQMGTAAASIPSFAALREYGRVRSMLDGIDAGSYQPGATRLDDRFGDTLARRYLTRPEEREAIRKRLDENTVSAEGTRNELLQAWGQYKAEMEQYEGRTPNFTDIRDAKSFGDWFAYNFGQSLPYFAISALAAGTGGLAGGAAGAGAGVLASGYGMGVGDIQSELIEKGQGEQFPNALAGAAPYAALDFLGPVGRVFRTVSGNTLRDVASSYFRRLGREVPQNAIEEFVNEAGQEIIKDAAVTSATGEAMMTDEALLRWFNAGMAGAAGGAPMAAVSAIPGPSQAQQATSQPQAMPQQPTGPAPLVNIPPSPPAGSQMAANSPTIGSQPAAAPQILTPEPPPPPPPKPGRDALAAMLADPRPLAEIEAAKAAEQQAADQEVLARYSLPDVGKTVVVRFPDGQEVSGEILGGIEQEGQGFARIRGQDGQNYLLSKEDADIALAEGDGTKAAPAKVKQAADIDAAARQVNQQPTEAQKEAGNYQKGHVKFQGLDIAIENPAGSTRSGVNPETGEAWEVQMPTHYGYIKRSTGADGDHVDVYMGPNPESDWVWIVDQIDPDTGKFDEHKVMLGYSMGAQAGQHYIAAFSDGRGRERAGAETRMTMAEFKAWLKDGDTKKPLAYVEPAPAPSVTAEPVQGDPFAVPPAAAPPAPVAPQPVAAPSAAPAGVADPAAELNKLQVTAMTDEQLALAAQVYGPGHKRAKPVEKEILRRQKAITKEREEAYNRGATADQIGQYDARERALGAAPGDKKAQKSDLVAPAPAQPAAQAEQSHEAFLAALPKDPQGKPDMIHAASRVLKKVIGKLGADWNSLTPEQQAKAIDLAKQEKYIDPKPARKQAETTTEPVEGDPFATPAEPVENRQVLTKSEAPAYGSENKLVTADRAAELRARLKAKLKNQLSAGIDPEIMAIGAELAAFHIEAGARKFVDLARRIAADLDVPEENLRQYLRSWYNGARDMMEDAGADVAGMDNPDQVRAGIEELFGAGDKTNAQERGSDAGPVGEAGVRETGGPVADGQSAREGSPGVLEGPPTADDGGAGAGRRSRGAGARSRKPPVDRGADLFAERDAADGREGTGGARLDADGAGERGLPGPDAEQPAATRPNFYIADPEQLIGGGPKARFNKNRAAIEAYRAITEEGRDPTQQDLDAMAGYTGWGSFGQELFQGNWERPRPKEGWQNEDKWLREHLGQAEWESAQSSIINAHYTDPPTVQAMWKMVERMGFKGGRILEPSMGIGNFFGFMPRAIEGRSDLTGIELDKLTGGMAQLLYPRANVSIKGYQESKTPDNFYDLVIGNWPFAALGPSDRRYDKLNATLHDYFFVKALDQVRPGGIVIGITSAGTMDKVGKSVRMELAKKAELVAAFRLPSGAFEKYAGTAVVTDIIILKKREKPIASVASEGWIDTQKMATDTGNDINVNEYFLRNPGNVLGKLTFGSGSTYGRAAMIVERQPDFAEKLAALPARVPEGAYTPPEKRGKEPRFETNNTTDRQGSITLPPSGRLSIVQGERLVALEDVVPFKVKDERETAKREDQVKQLVEIRRAYGRLIDAERAGADDTEAKRTELKKAYDAFVKKHGSINNSAGLTIFERAKDPFQATLEALETPDGKPSRILSEPTIRSKKKPQNPSVRDAFVLARNEAMQIDLERVATLSKKPLDQVTKELIDSKAIYRTPGGAYEVADVYLSGNVRRKLREALEAKERGEDMDASIEALRSVQPKDVPYYQIEAKMGATWVPNIEYRNFIQELLGVDDTKAEAINVAFKGSRWRVNFDDRSLNNRTEAETTWGTDRYRFDKLLSAAMNNVSIKITTKDEDGNTVTDEKATKVANEKAARVREEFSSWIWRDADRKIELEKAYNEVMNAIATPKFDGSFLEFPGMALHRGKDQFSLRKHQIDAIWRGLVNRRGIFAHEVGTGKTYTMGGIAVESRRYGIAKKPLIIAHNANSATVAREINDMYPGAKVLYVDNLTPDTIAVTMRRIANDDWDAVVIPHSLIDRMGLSEATLMELTAEEIAALEEEAIEAAKEDNSNLSVEDMDDEDAMKKVRSPTAKQLVKQRNQIIKKIQDAAVRASRENAVMFEDMGVDMIIVDEAHEFKKPPIATRMRMKGLNTGTSDRSIQLRFLTDYVKRLNAGTGVHTFTGTPITNTLTEIYNQMRYVMDDEMARDGIKEWDAWFNTFADSTTDVELTATGEYEPVTRLASFVNVAELRRMAGQYMDIVFADDMPEFKPRETASGKNLASKDLTEKERAELSEGRAERPIGRPYKKIITDVGPLSPQQEAALQELVRLARKFKNASKKERRELMLSGDPSSPVIVETNAANAGMDVRLYQPDAEDHPQSKVNRAVKNLLSIYKESKTATQVVFMERGFADSSKRTKTDKQGNKTVTIVDRFNLVKDMVDKLVAGGIPRNQIAIVDGKVSKEKRKEIADKMNRSEIRVVIGNTRTLGVGVNMQENLRAMHHMDAPWMPGDLEQRNGRGWRQGNRWNTVLEYRYITEKLDGRRWQVLAVKDRFIKAFLKADENTRIIDGDATDADEKVGADDLAATLAEAAGDPRILIQNKLKSDVARLEERERLHTYGIREAKQKAKYLAGENESLAKQQAEYEADADFLDKRKEGGEEFSAIIAGKTYNERTPADDAMADFVKGIVKGDAGKIGSVNGFDVFFDWKADWMDNPRYYMRKTREYSFRAGSIASIEGTQRGIRARAEKTADEIATNKDAIKRLGAMVEMPFQQGSTLEKKRTLLKEVVADMQRNPVPAPSWLRFGAPVGTEIYVDGKPRQVEGHKWGDEDWYVVTPDGDVPYLDARAEDGGRIYDPRPFTPPVKKDEGATPQLVSGAPQRKTADDIEDDEVPFLVGDKGREEIGERLLERLRAEVKQLGLSGVELADVKSLAGGVRGAYWRRVIVVAMDGADKLNAVRHEAIHAMRNLGLFRPAEWKALEVMAREKWIDQYQVRERWGGLSEDQLIEEAIAEAFADYARGAYKPGGLVHRAFATIKRLLNAIKAVFNDNGITSWEQVFDDAASGRIGRRDKGAAPSAGAVAAAVADVERAASRRDPGEDVLFQLPPKESEEKAAEASDGLDPQKDKKIAGADDLLVDDAGWFKRAFLHPRMIASMEKAFVPVYRAAVRMTERRDELAAELTTMAKPYFDLAPEKRGKVDAALELGRLQGSPFTNLTAIKNTDAPQAALSKLGEVVALDAEQQEAYKAVRKAMDKALDEFKTQVIRDWDFDPAEIKSSRDAMNAIDDNMGLSERTALENLSRVLREIEQARRSGYVPFTRWGQVGIQVTRDSKANSTTGEIAKETAHFEKVELANVKAALNRKFKPDDRRLRNIPEVAERIDALQKQFPGAKIRVFQTGTAGPLEDGVKLSDLDMLAEVAQINDDAWKEVRGALSKAIQSTGFRKHFFGAQNVPGYSSDFERAIADYIIGISGYLARREYQPLFDRSIASIPDKQPKLREYAQKYRDYVNKPQEEFQTLRQLGFVWYLAGSFATAVVNLTQVPMITAPYLAQFVSAGRSGAELARAYRDALKMATTTRGTDMFDPSQAPADMREDFQRAWDEGFFVPLNTWEVMGAAQNRSKKLRGLSKKTQAAVDVVALMFSAAERLNRIVTFIAGHRIGRMPGTKAKARSILGKNALARSDELLRGFTPAKFAGWLIDETHYRMGKVNRPSVMRGVGTAILQFKGFLMQTLELLFRLAAQNGPAGRKAIGLVLVVLMFTAGLWGLPFADDLTDLIEAMIRKFWKVDKDLRTEFRSVVGELTGSPALAEALAAGVPRAAGLEVSARLGLGNAVPDDLSEALGIPLDFLIGRAAQAMEFAQRGQWELALAETMPNFLKNAITAASWGTTGVRSQMTGKTVIPPEKVTVGDVTAKALGFTPSRVANIREAEFAQSRASKASVDQKREFYFKLARAGAAAERAQKAGNTEAQGKAIAAMQEIYAEIAAFNEGRPAYQQVKIDKKTLQARTAEELVGAGVKDKTAPKQSRGRRQEIEDIYGVD